MKVAVVGDSFLPASIFLAALERLGIARDVSVVQLDERDSPEPESVEGLRESIGSPAQLVGMLTGHEALLVHAAPVTEQVLGAAPQLRLVCCARGGPVNVDVSAATRRGIPVAVTPGKNAEAVAELTIMLMVMLARRVPGALRHVARGTPLGESALEGAGFLGTELGGRVLGLVGFGQVGAQVARRAAALGMDVVVHDPYVEDLAVAAAGHRAASLDELVATADFVSVHARATAETQDMFGAELFGAMRPGAHFVNTARETLVDEGALLAALQSGRLAGAALDVVRPRPDGSANPLVAREDVVVLPHIGGATEETLARGAAMAAEEVRRLMAGEAPLRLANPGVLAAG